jgi:hypothetical protein
MEKANLAVTTTSKRTKWSLPPLYLHYTNKEGRDCGVETIANDPSSSMETLLPCEILLSCFTFADWGDLAKLSCVQKSWKNIVRDAANHGGVEAKWELAQALLNGTNGLTRNSKIAIEYLTTLARGSHLEDTDTTTGYDINDNNQNQSIFTPAMRMLAKCYLNGDGVERDVKRGIEWLEDAALLGFDIHASHELAVIYELGKHDVDVDVVAAARWFHHAAENGHVEAMAEYALCCELGCGVQQSYVEALEWYVKAANAGHAEASYSVGEAYEEAKGVPQSDGEACLWYYKAAVMGDEDSKQALQRLRDIARIVVPGLGAILHD